MTSNPLPTRSIVRKTFHTCSLALLLGAFSAAPAAWRPKLPALPPVAPAFYSGQSGSFAGNGPAVQPVSACFSPKTAGFAAPLANLAEKPLLQIHAIAPSFGAGHSVRTSGLATMTLPDWSSNSLGLLGIGLVSLIGFFSLRRSNRFN